MKPPLQAVSAADQPEGAMRAGAMHKIRRVDVERIKLRAHDSRIARTINDRLIFVDAFADTEKQKSRKPNGRAAYLSFLGGEGGTLLPNPKNLYKSAT